MTGAWAAVPRGLTQREPDWFARRALWPSGSTIHGILATPAGYARELKARLDPRPSFSNAAMEHGTAMEPVSRVCFELINRGVRVRDADGYECPTACMFVSPDGFLQEQPDQTTPGRLLEIKNVVTRDMHGRIPAPHVTQVQACMAGLNTDWGLELRSTVHLQTAIQTWPEYPGADELDSANIAGVLFKCGGVMALTPDMEPERWHTEWVRCWWALRDYRETEIPIDPAWLPRAQPVLRKWKAELDAAQTCARSK